MIPESLKARLVLASGAGAIAIASVLVSHFEGRRYIPYRDTGGVLTVCEGHTGADVIPGRKYSDAECDDFKSRDLMAADHAVRRLITVPLSDWVRAGLIDYTFNLGAGNLEGSTMRKRFNAGDYAGGCAELDRWVKGKKAGQLVTLPGLVARREADTWVCQQ